MAKFPCPCCFYRTLDGNPPGRGAPPGTFQVCSVCFWEDLPVQSLDIPPFSNEDPDEQLTITLREARRNFDLLGAMYENCRDCVRPPNEDEKPRWPDYYKDIPGYETMDSATTSCSPAAHRGSRVVGAGSESISEDTDYKLIIKSLTNSDLTHELSQSISGFYAARDSISTPPKETKKLGRRLNDLLQETESRGEAGIAILLELFGHEDPLVRLWAASTGYKYFPDKARKTIEPLVTLPGIHGLSAEKALERFDETERSTHHEK